MASSIIDIPDFATNRASPRSMTPASAPIVAAATTAVATPASAPSAPAEGTLAIVDQLLRDQRALLARIQAGTDAVPLARALLLTIMVAAAAFGAALGAYRGGVQILFAGIKLPFVVLLTAAICAPALVALRRALTGELRATSDLALVLASLARGSLIIAALAPVVVLAIMWGVSYHSLILLVVACCSVGGLVGVALFARGLTGLAGLHRLVAAGALLGLFAIVGAQMSWTLRPYLVRPRAPEPTFLRPVESSFFEALLQSADSAQGIYYRDEAPLPGDLDPSER